MYSLCGVCECLKTVALAAKYYMDCEINSASLEDVKKALYQFAVKCQPKLPKNDFGHLAVVRDIDITKQLCRFYEVDSVLNDKDQSYHVKADDQVDNEVWHSKLTYIENALSEFQALCSKYYNIFHLVFSFIFVGRSKFTAGGSTSAAIGVLMLDPRKDWNCADIFEVFVHELIHQLVF